MARENLSEPPGSILILKPSSFGDIIHALPAVARLKARWPAVRLSWLVNPEWSPLLRENSLVDEVVIFPRREFRGWRGWRRLQRWLRQEIWRRRPELAVDFQGLLRTALLGRLSNPGRFYGLADAREGARWLYDQTATGPGGVPHAVERYLALSHVITGETRDGAPPATNATPLSYPLPEGQPVDPALGIPGGYILLHPFARGEGKSLSTTQVEAICHGLSPRPVVVVGHGPRGSFSLPANAFNLLDQTSLLQLLWLIRRAAFVISVDSGPVHLAAALDRPLASIHTWSDPRRVGPYRPDAWIVKHGKLLQVHSLRTCDDAFFTSGRATGNLTSTPLDAICELAISSLDSCA